MSHSLKDASSILKRLRIVLFYSLIGSFTLAGSANSSNTVSELGIQLIGQQSDGTILLYAGSSSLDGLYGASIRIVDESLLDDLAQAEGSALVSADSNDGSLAGIHGSGLRGIHGSGLRGIHGSGLRGIHGSGLRGIHGSGLRGIHGSGLRGIHGSGLRGIHGSGLRGIHGSGLRGIHGSGLRGIHGSGLRADLEGGQFQAATIGAPLIAIGQVQSKDGDFSSVTIAGQEIYLVDTTSFLDMTVGVSITGSSEALDGIKVGDYVAVAGSPLAPGQAIASVIVAIPSPYIAGSSPIYLRVIVDDIDDLAGLAGSASTEIDLSTTASGFRLTSNSAYSTVEVFGYSSSENALLFATSAANVAPWSSSAEHGSSLSEDPSLSDTYGIHGSGLRGIHGSGLRGIHGSGLRGIHGSGLRGIHGSGLRGIHGSGLRGIHGSGLRSADSTDASLN